MFYKINKAIHMRQGINREHLSMCGINIRAAVLVPRITKATCKNCRRVMKAALKYNKFYEPYL